MCMLNAAVAQNLFSVNQLQAQPLLQAIQLLQQNVHTNMERMARMEAGQKDLRENRSECACTVM